MVKRQTVWLSTMMVLSLMLIGYYTMNNPTETTNASSPSVTTTVGTPDSASSSTSPSLNASSSQSTSESSVDFFVATQTQVDKNMSETLDNLRSVIANSNASTEQIGSAEDQIKQLMDLKGQMANAVDAVEGAGYKECVVVPDANDKFTVYVSAKKLSADDAVQVMNLVAQQLGVPMTNIIVTPHA
ncbi:SpoIIIAH-like family protein [Alicyclobacillus tolerans]|uniref:Stage III sporulation protein AH n=2 Tax=Alicyclobacillus tolerans TaxID=90970 RepID=A0ABT9LWV0_9BACL|nr:MULTISPECIES: SpoIIIAH-like family protein [Alicyclobacillus]MDP9728744.1 stage III sporulation protein AH [Alicyclobacillus tengchongensis]QRF23244.1 SpoIIIAH-like family protein [Alicyclobacillus sp. TC]SHK39419.1 stage III sporulation protein AH [Alicyclobacillus montanus]